MFHDTALARQAKADPRPASAVSHGVGLAGLAGMILWVAIARVYGMDGPYSALVNVVACGLPMVLWAVFVDKVHRRPSTGIDWARPRALRETLDISLTKLAGLWLTWAGIALIYVICRAYWQGNFLFSMWCLGCAAPFLFVLSIPYVLWLDRYLVEPKDGAYAFGAMLIGTDAADREAVHNHLRSWAVKGFYIAFMLAIVPPGFGDFIRTDSFGVLADPVRLANWLITFMFVIDVAFATVGYMLTMRPLDAHIRSANPYAAAWTAALICYPPFVLMDQGGLFDYQADDNAWSLLFAGHPVILTAIGATMVLLTALYAWATVAFGFRFSNLTNRGILTHGPYAWSRHPAYLAKNAFWWLSTLPFLAADGMVDGVRNTVILAAVSGVYYWRAKTEERHLKRDPDYVAYWEWMQRNGPVPRFFASVTGKRPAVLDTPDTTAAA